MSRHATAVDSSLSCPRPVGAVESSAVDRPAFRLIPFFHTFSIFSLACQRCSFKCTDPATLDAHEAEFHLCKVGFFVICKGS